MFISLSKNKFLKTASLFIALTFLNEMFAPTMVLALTGGPSQPEVQSFEPIGTSEMVDPFTGDFVYNIPLLDVSEYPINLSYRSGITMDQEASWVGLGWNINAGVITRGMRGMPDDFKGDYVKKTFNIRPNRTWGANVQLGDIEIVGAPFINVNLGIGFGTFYNNYKGMGYEFALDPTIGIGDKEKGGLNIGLGLSVNSQEGLGVEPTLGLSLNAQSTLGTNVTTSAFNAKVGAPYNSRAGLKAITLSASVNNSSTKKWGNTRKNTYRSVVSPGISSTLPVNMETYIPQISMPMTNTATSVSAGVGPEAKWTNFKGRLSGYYQQQKLMFNELTLPAYGYMNSNAGQNIPFALHDFNREKDGSFTDQTPAIALANHTYDVYNVSAQGLGGMYRPYRSDIGRVYDNFMMSMSTSNQVGGDIGGADVFKGGLNGGFSFTMATFGNWSGGMGSINSKLDFKNQVDNAQFEPFYLKQAGELSNVNSSFYSSYGGDNPIRLEIDKAGARNSFAAKALTGAVSSATVPTNNIKANREHRSQVISVLTAGEADATLPLDAAYPGKIVSYGTSCNYSRTDKAQSHHITELSVLKTDGSRYVFGIPAYNYLQKEVTFNVGKKEDGTAGLKDCATGLVTYDDDDPGDDDDPVDNSTENKRGIDYYYESTELPPFAHSYLLTAVLSADYVDRTGNGPSDDDFGSYTKFNYNRVYGGSTPYHWRVPYGTSNANYNEGLRSDPMDDKASYVYGQKEVWYIHSIETKTHIAEFELKSREDAMGVAGENGGSGQKLKKLTSITLYAKCDKETNPGNPVIIKKVHFEYDYSLCPRVDNNSKSADPDGTPNSVNGGKLTLKKVYFTYGGSMKGKLSPYEFTYADPDHDGDIDADFNPAYDLKDNDRWGNYKKRLGGASDCNLAGPPSNSEFPYVNQNKIPSGNALYDSKDPERTFTDIYAQAWHLTSINLPSGGSINIDYESDDYAYVQDKRAMQMFTIYGMKNSAGQSSEQLYSSSSSFNNFVHIKNLPVPISSKEDFANKYLRDEDGRLMDNLYFRFLVDVIGLQFPAEQSDEEYEYISGYADIEDYDVVTPNEAIIKLKADDFGDKADSDNVNPIAKTAWQFARLHLSKLIYPGSEPNGTGESALRGLLSVGQDIETMFKGFNKALCDRGFGQTIIAGKSMLRLYSPGYKKEGGGTRVKKLAMSDKWSTMVTTGNGKSTEYGQEYFYTKTHEVTGATISSGVAEYEPMVGNEENPWRQPVSFTIQHRLAPDDRFYHETPYGECFFPSPNVGYSRVLVRNLQRLDEDDIDQDSNTSERIVTRTATGYVVHEFYTARDFPVYTRQTEVDKKRDKPSWITRVLKLDIEDNKTVSQGFLVELNDMHGKPKAQWVYQEYPDGTPEDEKIPISGVEYFYQTDPANSQKLSNEVSAFTSTGALAQRTVGKEMDIVADFRENKSRTTGGTFQANLDVSLFPFPPPPIPIPSFWVTSSKESTRFRSTAVTKVITRYGILKETIAHDLGSRVSTQNLAYDAETGEVLLTKTQNDFNDPIYSFTYPAHWAYNGMGMAFKNIGFSLDVTVASGAFSFANANEFCNPGDELLSGSSLYWVKAVSGSAVQIIDRDGNAAPAGSYKFKVIRSGRRNMQATPIGTVTAKSLPVENSKLKFKDVLNASAVEFTQNGGEYCECGVDPNGANPYLAGNLGNWRAKRSLLYLTDRTQSDLNTNTNIRVDGRYKNFTPYWLPPLGGEPWDANSSALNMILGWTFTSEVTLYSPFGFELENRDALGRHSAATYGYSNTLPTAVASNSKYKEIGFESFEDQGCINCDDDHFRFPVEAADLSDDAHSGKYSLKVEKGNKIILKKNLFTCEELNIPTP